MSAPTWSDGARATALALIGQYGEDAEVMAVMRAAELAAMGDVKREPNTVAIPRAALQRDLVLA